MPVARVRVEIRKIGRIDAALPKAHGRQTVQVWCLRAIVCQEWSSRFAHEKTSAQAASQVIITQLPINHSEQKIVNYFIFNFFVYLRFALSGVCILEWKRDVCVCILGDVILHIIPWCLLYDNFGLCVSKQILRGVYIWL